MESGRKSALFPTYGRYPYTLVKGEGSRLWDDQGKEYLDFASGLAVTNLGHVPPRVKERLVRQLDELWHVSNLFHIPNQEKLAALLTRHSCADAVFFCNSGAEANEAAIKLARRYHRKVLGNDRYTIITFERSFHGRTLTTLTATGQDKVKDGFDPLPEGFIHVPLHDLAAVEAAVDGRTAAIMIEPVVAEGGVLPVEDDFLRSLRELCDRHGLLLIFDEVQTGMGRTGKLFAYQHSGVEPDIFTLAKGLGSGFPVGAMLAKEHLVPAFSPGTHASTFGGTPIAMAAVIATLETMLELDVPAKAAEAGEYLMRRLREETRDLPNVAEIRGKGLLVGIQCAHPVADAVAELHRRGLLVVTAGPEVIRLLPNLLVTREEIDEAADKIAAVLRERVAGTVG